MILIDYGDSYHSKSSLLLPLFHSPMACWGLFGVSLGLFGSLGLAGSLLEGAAIDSTTVDYRNPA